MANLAWTAWFDEVRVPKAPAQVVQNAVRDAARELCTKGKVYLLDSDPIDMVAGTKEYPWTKSGYTDVEVIEIWQALFNSYELTPFTREQLKTKWASWPNLVGTPEVYLRLRPSVIRLVPYPAQNSTAALIVWAYLRPVRTATGISSEFGERYYNAIAKGALAKLLMRKGTPYYDPQLGSAERREFEVAMGEANLAAELGENDNDLEGDTVFM